MGNQSIREFRNIIFSVFIFVLLISPYFVFAQTPSPDLQLLIQQLQAQIKLLQNQIVELKFQLEATKKETAATQDELKVTKAEVKAISEELRLTRFLRKGESGEEVRKLQEFLKQFPDIYPEGLVTGYYGQLTESAVKRFQEKHEIVSFGDAQTTGYGQIGPRTLQKLNEFAVLSVVTPPAVAGRKTVICHYPTGNTENRHTLEISESALQEHLAHGDSIGECPAGLATTTSPTPVPIFTPVPISTPAQATTTPSTPISTPTVTQTPAPITATTSTTTTSSSACVTQLTPPISSSAAAPMISNVQVSISASQTVPGQINMTFTWTTDKYAYSGVEWKASCASGISHAGSGNLFDYSISHFIASGPFYFNTLYYYRVKSRDASGNLRESEWYTFTTPASVTTPAPSPSPAPAPSPSPTQTPISPTSICVGGDGRVLGLPICIMPENLSGTGWNEVDNATGKVLSTAVCSAAVCGRNGEWRTWSPNKLFNGRYYTNGYPENSTYIQTPFDAGRGGQYFTNGVWQTGSGEIIQPGSGQTTTTTSSDTTPPSVPTNLTASPSYAQITLSWTASTDNVGVKGYIFYLNGVGNASPFSTSYVVSSLIPSTTYTFGIAAYDVAGNKSAQVTISATTLADTSAPSVPTALTATVVSSTQINLSWQSSTDNSEASPDYKIYRNGTYIGWAPAPAYNDTNLSPSTAYTYTVAAYDAAGNVSAQSSPASVTTTTLTNTALPPTPPSFSMEAKYPGGLNFSWSALTDNIEVTGYRIYITNTSTNITTTHNYPVNYTGAGPSGFVQGARYSAYVTALDATGKISAPSPTLYATVIQLTTPTNFNAIATSPTSVSLTWSASQGIVYQYNIRRFTNNLDGAQTSVMVLVPATSYIDTTAQPGTSYIYWIQARSVGSYGSDTASALVITPISATATSTSLNSRSQNLAAIAQTLQEIKEKLAKLLQGL